MNMAGEITVSEDMLGSLKATKTWVTFLSIVGFVFCALMVLGALAMFAGVGSGAAGPMKMLGPGFGVFYLILVAIYFFPCLFLFHYGRAIGRIPSAGQSAMEEALAKQKSFWKYMGIVTIIAIGLDLCLILGAVLFGMMAATGGHS
jgi:hypothetical protein